MNIFVMIMLVLLGLIVLKIALIAVFFYSEIRCAQNRDPATSSASPGWS